MKVAGEGRSEKRSSVMGAIKLKKRGLDNDVVGRFMGSPWICDLGWGRPGTGGTVSGRLDLGWRLEYDG
jgi:hypothetical protein